MGRTVDVVLSDGRHSTIGWYAVAIAAAAAVVGVASVAAQGTLARAAEPALAELREDVVDRVLHLDHQRVEEAGVGDLVSRVGDDVRTIGRSLDVVVPTMIGSAVAVVFTVGGLVALDWRLGLAGLVAVPAYVLGPAVVPPSVRAVTTDASGSPRASAPRPWSPACTAPRPSAPTGSRGTSSAGSGTLRGRPRGSRSTSGHC